MRSSLFASVFGLLCHALPQHAEVVRCGSLEQPEHLKQNLGVSKGLSGSHNYFAPINGTATIINTYVHIITTEKTKKDFTLDMALKQINILNAAYNSSRIYFAHKHTNFVVNDTLASADADEESELQFKSVYREGNYDDLNLYFLSDYGAKWGGTILGRCPFPEEVPSLRDYLLDGCTLQATTLPGAPRAEPLYNEGKTAVHEIGHWFGLFHTFQGGNCDSEGDYVSDTPAQRTYTFGCPVKNPPDTCPGKAGLDPIHNYMDYSSDACLTQFSPLQTARMLEIFYARRFGN